MSQLLRDNIARKASLERTGTPDGAIMIQAEQAVRPEGGGAASLQWAIVTEIPEYDSATADHYTVQKASVNTSGAWVGDGTNITIDRALGYEGYDANATDIRNWLPWFKVGSIVRIVSRWDAAEADTIWYLDEPLKYVGGESTSSFRHNSETGHIVAVWV